ncbi:hypothetical protein LTR53_006099 [Teratosphaeriaceae sp. CCFEE 6253]|nr:hypothetical protein LTR53_006099 [Teratosphaeriaceae sp. CCFEE 6253]
MARRSSARLRSRNSSTPKRVSLSHDAGGRTPQTAPTKLESLEEHDDEMPGAFPTSPPANGTPTRPSKRVNIGVQSTPSNVTPIMPSHAEMHPQKHHGPTTKPMEDARHLGFSNMGTHTEPPKQSSRIATLQGTPTRAQNPAKEAESSTYQFTFRREHSLELSPNAKALMLEKREEAARLRAQMLANDEHDQKAADAAARQLATLKGKKGRFSEAHNEQFAKMDSIAAHPSIYRADIAKVRVATASQQTSSIIDHAKSLKRSPSKAQLDGIASAQDRTLPRGASQPAISAFSSVLPRATSSHALQLRAAVDPSSPTKRKKRAADEDVSAHRPPSSETDESDRPGTPQQRKPLRMHPSNPNLSHMTTPTQASLARATSVKVAKTSAIPALARSSSKPNLMEQSGTRDGPSTPLLARSPSKAALFSKPATDVAVDGGSPLLARAPIKNSPFKMPADPHGGGAATTVMAPLLARSPVKMPVAKRTDFEGAIDQQPDIPLLARSPSKIALPSHPTTTQVTASPGKTGGLMSRFNLLRKSPMKSILRSPQRLYSDDPAKVAAGTHFATPPKPRAMPDDSLLAAASARKRVDFTSSTKARYEDRGSRSVRSSSAEVSSVAPSNVAHVEPAPTQNDVDYPTLPGVLDFEDTTATMVSPSPQKRRQTVAPGDFTFRADGHGVVFFGQSPNASSAKAVRRPSIRHVSAEPDIAAATPPAPPTVQGSKKRKFAFENELSISASHDASDKENAGDQDATETPAEEEHRPMKRVKQTEPSPAKPRESTKPAGRLPTLGVKPKGTKTTLGGPKDGKSGRREDRQSTTTISQARLNALAMPKKRG